MIRLWRLILLLFGVFLFGITVLRWVQPARTDGLYLTIYGSRSVFDCCHTYMVNEDKRQANRVRVGSSEQPTILSPISADGMWMYARTRLSTSWALYLIHLPTNTILRAADEAAEGETYFWSSTDNILYYARVVPGESMAYYQVSPQALTPVRLTDPIFGFVRSTSQRGLPYTEFDPLIPMLYAVLVLFVAGGLTRLTRDH